MWVANYFIIIFFYLALLEVTLRNHLNNAIANLIKPNWLLAEINDNTILLGYKDKKHFKSKLDRLIKIGVIKQTIPDKPTSKNQKYISVIK